MVKRITASLGHEPMQMNRPIYFLRGQQIRLLGLGLLMAALAAAPAADQPNFLLIIADDLTWSDLGCAGNPDVKTPNIDRLASQGMSLRQMFTPAPTCSPLRHALYTGLFPIRSGAYPNHTRVYDGTASIFTQLKAIGYRVALQGKSHIGPPATFVYETLPGHVDNTPALAEFINRDKSQPWFVVVASNDPHSPWTRGPTNLYDPAQLRIPPYLHDNALTRTNLANYYAEISQLDKTVGAALQALDASGQADQTLVLFVSEQGSSLPYGGKWSLYDNGIRASAFARWPGRIKAGATSDALIQYVDVPPTFLEMAGVDPTKIDTGCPDATGKRGFDGRSFLSVLRGRSNQLRDYIFAQHTTIGIIGYKEPYPMRAVRDARYKFIRNLAPENRYWIGGIHGTAIFESWEQDAARNPALAARMKWLSHRPAEELYDLETDPYEQQNLAADNAFAAVKSRLARELDAWMAQQGDKGMATELAAKARQGAGRNAAKKQAAKPTEEVK